MKRLFLLAVAIGLFVSNPAEEPKRASGCAAPFPAFQRVRFRPFLNRRNRRAYNHELAAFNARQSRISIQVARESKPLGYFAEQNIDVSDHTIWDEPELISDHVVSRHKEKNRYYCPASGQWAMLMTMKSEEGKVLDRVLMWQVRPAQLEVLEPLR